MTSGMQSISAQEVIRIANEAQRKASDPRASVFVSASAGSGKTKLLIDRLLRLMLPLEGVDAEGKPKPLPGSDPSRILCLTYTKAAAAEMANRLQARLGKWVSLPDEALGQELRALDVPDTQETRARARGLFLRVLDLPGGLRIETIHAFCQSLLRRFPLEAALDPHFTLMEETDSTLALRQALEGQLASAPLHDVTLLAEQITLGDLLTRIVGLNEKSGRLAPLVQMWSRNPAKADILYHHLLNAGQGGLEALESEARRPPQEQALRAELQAALSDMTEKGQKKAHSLLNWLATAPDDRTLSLWRDSLLTKEGKPRSMNTIVAKKAQGVASGLIALLMEEAERQVVLQQRVKAQELLAINRALIDLAMPVLARFQQEKARRGVVDYNDLIAHTRAVLREPGAAWVLYKLDGGIDHLLLDEVQDTSTQQWEIAGALTEDFFSGQGTRESQGCMRPRTIFAVGDFKQSIYSFQGAEPEQFHAWRRRFAERVKKAGLLWREPELHVSFRSVAPVLALVDSVFENDNAAYGVREEGAPALKHLSARPGEGGSVELWPLVPAQENGEVEEESPTPWQAPRRNADQRSAPQRLAEALAFWISQQIGQAPQEGKPALKAGDVLILVPRRSFFLRSLIRALKMRQVPVASFTRTGLTEQVAVRDLMTLCAALLLPQDDLTLASVLTSPLGGISDDSLMALATDNGSRTLLGRNGKPLWDVLRDRHEERDDWQAAWQWLSALYRRVDYETPHSLLVQALGQQGGRARLLARLGPEAAEPVDELLTAALEYETHHAPSLQGFVHWLENSAIDSRREAESETDAVRIMTVHGSKGLQARLVILPDTTSSQTQDRDLLWGENEAVALPLWVPRKDMATPQSDALRQEAQERQRAERNRLLYVALTRASDQLVVCGWEPKKGTLSDSSWYHHCEEGFQRLVAQGKAVTSAPLGMGWAGERLLLEETCHFPGKRGAGHVARPGKVGLPQWAGHAPDWQAVPPPEEEPLTRPLAPSRPEGVEFGLPPAARSPLEILDAGLGRSQPDVTRRAQAMQRGRLIHRLLQLLPDLPVGERLSCARSWLSRPAWGLEAPVVERLADQVIGVLDDARLAPLFASGSRAEQSISGILATHGTAEGRVVLGKVDRFSVQDDTVWLCDYKTGRRPPRDLMQVPVAYRRQMAAYRAVMAGLYPGHAIRCFVVWTEGPEITELSEALLQDISA